MKRNCYFAVLVLSMFFCVQKGIAQESSGIDASTSSNFIRTEYKYDLGKLEVNIASGPSRYKLAYSVLKSVIGNDFSTLVIIESKLPTLTLVLDEKAARDLVKAVYEMRDLEKEPVPEGAERSIMYHGGQLKMWKEKDIWNIKHEESGSYGLTLKDDALNLFLEKIEEAINKIESF